MSTRKHLFGLPVSTMLAASFSIPVLPVFAEEDALLEEVVVTARKREERLQDLPGSAAALTSDLIEATGGIESLRDLTDLITGITINETNTQFLSEPSIRGAGQSRNRASVSATGLYRNGAYFATNGLGGKNFSRMDSYDVGRVEALRGPQGALYGRNALGGAINMISKQPGDEFNIELGYGGDASDARGLSRVDVRVDLPVSDNLAVRIGHLREDYDDGRARDINGNVLDNDQYDLTRFAVRYEPTDRLKINYSFDTEDTETYPILRSRTGTEALRGFTIENQNYFVNTDHFLTYAVDNHNLNIDLETGTGLLTSVTNYRKRDLFQIADVDHQLANANVAQTRQRGSATTSGGSSMFQEFRFVADSLNNFQWLLGMDFYRVKYDEFINAGARQQFSTQSMRWVNVDQNSWALFGSLDYTLDNLPVTLSAELRYARDTLDGSVYTVLPLLPASPVLPPAPGGGFIQTDFADDPEFTNLPYSLAASWSIDNDKLAYVKWANSYRHGGLNLNEGQPQTDPYPVVLSYDSESANTLELGFKSSWFDRTVTVNAATYYIWYEDFLDTATNGCDLDLCVFFDPQTGVSLGFAPDGTPIEIDPDGNPGLASGTAFYIDNVGEVEAWGIELETVGRFRLNDTGTMRVSLGWGRQMGRVESINADASPAVQLLDNLRLNQLRPRQIKGSLLYRQGLGVGGGILDGLRFVASLSYTNEQGGFINLGVNQTPIDDVEVVNANIGFEANQWSLMFRGRNVTDEMYERWRSATSGNRLVRYNDPAQWEFNFTWRLR
ncbi:MAG: TonB-dependent receptor [Pseudomonadota bacterium]